MHNPFLATTVLASALLFSQGGNFLVAAFCPHLQSAMASCNTQLADPEMSHEDMGHMEMDSKEHEPASNPNPYAAAVGEPIAPCSHCAIHSRTNTNALSLRETEAVKRSGDAGIPFAFSRVAPVSACPVAVLTSRAHGPPGDNIPRHILINIFRI